MERRGQDNEASQSADIEPWGNVDCIANPASLWHLKIAMEPTATAVHDGCGGERAVDIHQRLKGQVSASRLAAVDIEHEAGVASGEADIRVGIAPSPPALNLG
jgi:hypothetical protein